jgi:hypothetical protein
VSIFVNGPNTRSDTKGAYRAVTTTERDQHRLPEDKIMAMNALHLTDMEEKRGETVEPSKEEGHAVMDSYFDLLGKAIASIPTGGTQFGEKLKTYLGTNIATARDYMRKLSQAKDFRDVVRAQIDFAQAQFNAFSGQAKDLSETYSKTAADALNTPFKKAM